MRTFLLLLLVSMINLWAEESLSAKEVAAKDSEQADEEDFGEAEELRQLLAKSDIPWYDDESDNWRAVVVENDEELSSGLSYSGGGAGLAFSAQFITGIIVAVVVVGLVFLIVQLMAQRRQLIAEPARPTRTVPKAILSALPMQVAEEELDPEALLARAIKSADWSSAVVWLYVVALMNLHQYEHIVIAAGKTNRRYIKECPVGLREPLRFLVKQFERVYFGHFSSSEIDFRKLEQHSQPLLDVGTAGSAGKVPKVKEKQS